MTDKYHKASKNSKMHVSKYGKVQCTQLCQVIDNIASYILLMNWGPLHSEHIKDIYDVRPRQRPRPRIFFEAEVEANNYEAEASCLLLLQDVY